MTFRDAPPSPQGMIFDQPPAGAVHWRACEAVEASRVAWGLGSPSSNTGMILTSHDADAAAFVDYLKFTLRGLKGLVEKARRRDVAGTLPDGFDELREVFRSVATGGWDITATEARNAQTVLDALQPDTARPVYEPLAESLLDRAMTVIAKTVVYGVGPALVFGDLTGKGRDGYKNHLKIFTHLGKECGFIAVGGNAETVHVNLTGESCQRIDMAKLADVLDGFDCKVGRIDAAWDDMAGRFGSPRDAADHYRAGGFAPTLGGIRSNKVTWYDDLGTGAGCTFQLGDRSSRMFRMYEKGKKAGDTQSPWARYEVQYMGSAFDLTTDNIRNPGALLTQYPDLEFLPVNADGDRLARVRREAEINIDKTARWLRVTCGAALTLIADAIGAETMVRLVENDKTPRRLRGLANSRKELGDIVADALMDSRKYAPVALTSIYLSAEMRERSCSSYS